MHLILTIACCVVVAAGLIFGPVALMQLLAYDAAEV